MAGITLRAISSVTCLTWTSQRTIIFPFPGDLNLQPPRDDMRGPRGVCRHLRYEDVMRGHVCPRDLAIVCLFSHITLVITLISARYTPLDILYDN